MEFQLPILAPSILAADHSRLGEQIQACMNADIQWIHCDIMDGHFVPNISFGAGIVETVRNIAPDLFLDVHLMIEDPDRYIESFADAGADLISVHAETCPHLHRTLQMIRLQGCMTGVVLNPATPVAQIEPILQETDLVLIMSVNPGFGGQSFIESSYKKVQRLAALRESSQSDFLIEIDGGVTLGNIQKLVRNGVDVLVAGSSVFKADDIPGRIKKLTEKAALGRTNLA